MAADNPLVTIEISGLRGAGKSVLAAHLRKLLIQLGIDFTGPLDLPARLPGELATAIDHLRARGLNVAIMETRTGISLQVDARMISAALGEKP